MEVTITQIIADILEVFKEAVKFIVPLIAVLGGLNFIVNLIITAFIGIGGRAGRLK